MGPISGAQSETPYLNGITEEAARELLRHDASEAERIVNNRINVPLFPYEYDAIVDFVYNHRSHNDDFFEVVNSGQYGQVPWEFLQYTSAHGQHPLGLVRRRRSEGHLFATGNYDATH
jgi:lysozyme